MQQIESCFAASRFHEIEPQSSVMELLRPSQLSRKVLSPPRGCVPASELAANTLVLSGWLPATQSALLLLVLCGFQIVLHRSEGGSIPSEDGSEGILCSR